MVDTRIKELWDRNQSDSARQARAVRRARREELIYSKLRESLDEANESTTHQLTTSRHKQAFSYRRPQSDHRDITPGIHPGQAAIGLVHEAFGQYNVSGRCVLRYGGMERKAGRGAYEITEGVLYVEGELKPTAGMSSSFTVPVIVKEGRMLFPSCIVTPKGETRVIAQSTIDDLLGYGAVDQEVDNVGGGQVPRIRTKRMSAADREAIRAAVRGWDR